MKKIIETNKAPKAIGSYSQAVEVNGILYISGQIPINPETDEINGSDIFTQTKQVLDNIGGILEAAGYTFKDVVKSKCLLSDMNNFQSMNEVYTSYYSSEPPARAAYEVSALPLGVLIEIETIAVKS